MRRWTTEAVLAAALLAAPAMAQDTLTLGTAVRMALEQELGVRIAANSAQAAEELATPGNAGLLPRIDATAQGSYNNNYSRLDFAEGIPDVERSGVESTSWGATLQAAWTVFNGNGNRAAYQRSIAAAGVADIAERGVREAVVLQAAAAYYAVAGLEENLTITEDLLRTSLERYQRAEDRATVGGGGRLDALNALVDLQSDSATWIGSRQALEQARNELAVALGQEPDARWNVSRTVSFTDGLVLEDLERTALGANADLLIARGEVEVSAQDARMARALRWPRLDLTGRYGLTDQKNEVGVVLGSFNAGFTGGGSLSMPIFDGGRLAAQQRVAELQLESAELEAERARLRLLADLHNAWTAYEASRETLRLQRSAETTAGVNFELSQERYAMGQLTGIQFREAQGNYLQARRRRVQAAFDAVVAELGLLRASGILLGSVSAP